MVLKTISLQLEPEKSDSEVNVHKSTYQFE